jgi:hypothetical protein
MAHFGGGLRRLWTFIYTLKSVVGHASGASGHVCFAAESGSELSCRDAIGTNPMPETDTIDGPSVAKGVATVSASALALHFDCSRAYIDEFSQRRA